MFLLDYGHWDGGDVAHSSSTADGRMAVDVEAASEETGVLDDG